MREPAFWYRPPSWKSRLLMPLGAVYGWIAGQRLRRQGFDAGIPVLCVGNYHLGGAGKTPPVLALTGLLREQGERPVVLSRGYGGRLRGPVKVDPARHGAGDVGDEPLMLARTVAVVVARERIAGLALARAQGASVILMDDGFQNPAIAKDASLIVIDGHRGLGNGCVFPAGPLRAPLPPQLARTDALIVIGTGTAAAPVAAAIAARGRPVFSAHLEADAASVASLGGKRVLAFAGIGDPERFFRTLRGSGIEVVRQRAIRRSSRFFARRDRRTDRRGQARWIDAGDHGKGPGAAAPRRRDSCLGGRHRAVRGDARIRRCRRIAQAGGGPAVPGAGEEIFPLAAGSSGGGRGPVASARRLQRAG